MGGSDRRGERRHHLRAAQSLRPLGVRRRPASSPPRGVVISVAAIATAVHVHSLSPCCEKRREWNGRDWNGLDAIGWEVLACDWMGWQWKDCAGGITARPGLGATIEKRRAHDSPVFPLGRIERGRTFHGHPIGHLFPRDGRHWTSFIPRESRHWTSSIPRDGRHMTRASSSCAGPFNWPATAISPSKCADGCLSASCLSCLTLSLARIRMQPASIDCRGLRDEKSRILPPAAGNLSVEIVGIPGAKNKRNRNKRYPHVTSGTSSGGHK